jgi:exopolysaccharide production protein ExoQ
MGRDSTLTGRTELWKELIGMNANPMLGTGFESFWLGERLQKLWELHWWHPNEAHNGYLEVYLNLGFIGVAMLAAMIVKGYRNVRNQLNRDPETGRLLIAYFVVGLTYNFTEAAIRTTDPMWITFLLAIVAVPMACLPEETETRSAQSSLLSHAVATHMPLSPRRFHRTDPS